MRILMHCVYFPPEVGGLESHIHFLARALVQRGHQVDAVTSRSRPGLASHEVIDGIRVWRTWMPARNTPGWAAHAMFSVPRFRKLADTADVLHAQDIAAVLPCIVAQHVRGAPIVTTYHTSHFLRRADSAFWRPVFRRFLRAADHNLASSREIAFVAERIAPGVSVEAVTNGVDTAFFHRTDPALPNAPNGRARLVAPRRLFEKNGIEFLIRAVPLILEEADVEVVLIGDGPEREALEKLARQLGVAERVNFLGSRAHGDMPGLLSSADLAVFPSLMEATSVAALESMACELPVVASRVGGLPEIIDDEVGALCDPAAPEALARSVLALLGGGRLRAMGSLARARVVDRWSNDRLADRHVDIYEEVVAGRRAA
ncbi:MAG: glycosyltransferase family 4 protein [Gemmatimonadota bacterium]|nr:glycosyltransferase family 4 protein [Gemmatimonadota bacterium]